jgi:hypothetical protein
MGSQRSALPDETRRKPMSTELDRLVAEYRAAGLAHQDMLANIKTVWMNTSPRPEGTWENFCVIRLGKSPRQINRRIEGKTGNETRNVNGKSSDDPPSQSETTEEGSNVNYVCLILAAINHPAERTRIRQWIKENWK